MAHSESSSHTPKALAELLGYLNFSSGASDPKFLRNLNELFDQAADESPAREAWRGVYERLCAGLAELRAHSPTFADSAQAAAVLKLTFESVLPAYRAHHRDLLFHQTNEALFRPFFIGRVFEAVLAEGSPWDETARIVTGALARLNDYLGHRPVAVLNNRQKAEPYGHERVRPVPLYAAGAGPERSVYGKLAARALAIAGGGDSDLLAQASFDPGLLDELAFDPRAYDFNHPVNKRPNYHFGQWDPHRIDGRGHYRRFVVQQSLLEALLERVEGGDAGRRDELFEEAATVLAGTILMSSGTSGNGPDAHDSTTSLATLLPRIAAYRDAFYRESLARLSGAHGDRLRAEAAALRQPFAAARQHLNGALARRRALQMQHAHLAIQFARLGYPDAAMRQASIVPAASARMVCQLHCLLTAANQRANCGDLESAVGRLDEIEALLERGIECGAIVDPWNILGFGGQFSLFPAVENSVPDLRVDDLLELMEQIFALHARLWHEAAAADAAEQEQAVRGSFRQLAEWWDRFATTTVSTIKRVSGSESYAAAERVAKALAAWHKVGPEGGDTAFWRPHAEQFDSPQAYASVVEALLERGDLSAAQALLMHWLGQAERTALEDGRLSFHSLAATWMRRALETVGGDEGGGAARGKARRKLIERFFDHLEANADQFWEVPRLETGEFTGSDEPAAEEDEDEQDLFGAAYEEVIYRDSTADGIDADMLEAGGQPTEYELEGESSRVANRLAFLTTVARLWKLAALACGEAMLTAGPRGEPPAGDEAIAAWQARANRNRRDLAHLAHAIERQPLVASSSSHEALLEYDRRRIIRETLLEKVISTMVSMTDAEQLLGAVSAQGGQSRPEESELPEYWWPATRLWSAVLAGDAEEARRRWPVFLSAVHRQPLLYVPLAKGGDARRIAAARRLQQTFRDLLRRLPRLGMLRETCQLLQTARAMERDHPQGGGAVTEFDRLFEVGYKAVVESLIESSADWPHDDAETADAQLIECLQQEVTESLLNEWLSHSRTLRLSALEKVAGDKEWAATAAFIEQYGGDLFTHKFFHLGNLRAILHQGVETWLNRLADDPDTQDLTLVQALDEGLSRVEAKKHLSLVIEAVVENFGEYRDFNATTTQSDRGELTYTLLDFLRVKAAYERVHWNLRPVMMAHEALVRRGRLGAAALWRQAMTDRTHQAAQQHLAKLEQLEHKYGMRLSTVSDRLGERFVRSLAIDRVRALVKPAAEGAQKGGSEAAFVELEREAGQLAAEPNGAGLDLPDWLSALEDEVERACVPHPTPDPLSDSVSRLGWARLSWDEIRSQLSNWEIKFLEDKS